jgi:hypothetical protein
MPGIMLTDLADVLYRADLQVREVPGWQSRGHGLMTDVLGVTCHHTASGRGTGTTLGLTTIRDGRPGLDGPLAHLYLNREGTFYVVAAGLCWHAGVSRKPEYTNGHRIGIEALAAGDEWSEDWPSAQMDAYARGCKALADHYGFPVSEVLGHKETCKPAGRKPDPTFDMREFREKVATSGDDMKLTDEVTLSAVAAREMSQPGYTPRKGGDELSLSYLWQWGGPGMYRLLGRVDALTAQVAKLRVENEQQTILIKELIALVKNR